MIERLTTCQRIAEHLGPDGGATPEARAHLAHCRACQGIVDDLRRLRSILGRSVGPAAPNQLAARLTSIAGQDARAPLWLASTDTGALPSPRAQRRTRLAAGTTTLLLACCLLVVAGLVSAPPLAPVDHARAAVEYDVTTGAGATSTAITAVLAVPPEQLALSEDAAAPQLAPIMDWSPVSVARAKQLLASQPEVGYTGTQRVTLGKDGAFATAEVEVAQQPGEALQLAVLGRDGRVVTSGQVAPRQASEVTLPAAASSFRVAEGGTISGQQTLVLEAHRADGTLRARWWICETLGMVMWAQSFDPDLSLVRSAGFVSFTLTSQTAVESRATLQLSLAPAAVEHATPAMCTRGFSCAAELAGMPLVEISADSPANPTVVHAVYAQDGVRVSVVQQRGRLAPTSTPSYGTPQERAVRTWQSGTVVYTLTTNGGDAVAEAASQQLPHQRPMGRGVLARAKSGWARIVGR